MQRVDAPAARVPPGAVGAQASGPSGPLPENPVSSIASAVSGTLPVFRTSRVYVTRSPAAVSSAIGCPPAVVAAAVLAIDSPGAASPTTMVYSRVEAPSTGSATRAVKV